MAMQMRNGWLCSDFAQASWQYISVWSVYYYFILIFYKVKRASSISRKHGGPGANCNGEVSGISEKTPCSTP